MRTFAKRVFSVYMSVKWLNYIWSECSDLSGSALLCALAIADHADNDGRCFPGVASLATKIRKKPRQTLTILRQLEAEGYIRIIHDKGRGRKNVLQLVENSQIKGAISGQKGAILRQEKVQFPDIKGAISGKEKVQFSVTPLYKDEPLLEPNINRVREPEKSLSRYEPQIAEAHTMFDRFPLKEFFNAFPDAQISPSQAGMIESTVTLADAEAWKLTLEHYKANYDPRRNRYLPEKVGNLLSVFRSQKEKLNGQRPEPKRLPTAEELERENAAERADRSNWVYPTPRNDQEPRPIIDRPSR